MSIPASSLVPLDRSSPVPLFEQLCAWMRDRIQGGVWAPNHQLRSEQDLAGELGVNRGTIRRAIGKLVEEGLLIQVHGKGTFVRAPRLEGSLAQSLLSFAEALDLQGVKYETRVLSSGRADGPARITGLLALEPGVDVFRLERVRSVDGVPVLLVENYLAPQSTDGIEAVDFTRERLFDVLERRFNLKIRWAKRSFEARLARGGVARALALADGDPVMYIQQVVFSDRDVPLECSDIWIPGSRFSLSATVTRSSNWAAQLLPATPPEALP